MASLEFDRYSAVSSDNNVGIVPFVEIPKSDTDYYTEYKRGLTRLDIISNDYYGSPNYGWMILQANPEVGSMEFSIEDKTILRIPFPLENALTAYKKGIEKYKEFYEK